MNVSFSFFALLLLCVVIVSPSYAMKSDYHRVKQGIASGQITAWEANSLKHQQQKIKATRLRYMSDGVLTPWERSDLQKMERAQDTSIYKQKHD